MLLGMLGIGKRMDIDFVSRVAHKVRLELMSIYLECTSRFTLYIHCTKRMNLSTLKWS